MRGPASGQGLADDQARDQGQHVDTGERGRDTVDDLQVGRQVDQDGEHRGVGEEPDQRGEDHGPGAEHGRRQDRGGGTALDGHQQRGQRDGGDDQADDGRRAPAPALTERGGQDQAGGDRGQDGGAGVVDAGLGSPGGRGQRTGGDGEGDDADGQVDQEGPAPGELVGEDAAQQRADDAGDAVDRTEHPLVPAAFAGRDDVTDQGEGQHDHAAAADALEHAGADQLGEVLRQAAGHGSDQEDRGRGQVQALAAEHVAELAPQRRDRRGREEIGGADPGDVVEPVEVLGYPGQRRGDDRLVQGRQEDREDQRAHGGRHPAHPG